MKNWLMDIATEIHKRPTCQAEDHGKKIAIGTILIMCLLKLPIHLVRLDYKELALLLSLVELKPDVQTRTCHDFHHFKSLMSTSTYDDAFSAVRTVCISLARAKHLSEAKWLYAIPILHFIGGMCKPFQNLVFDPERLEVWRDNCIPLNEVEQVIRRDRSAQQGKYKWVIACTNVVRNCKNSVTFTRIL